MSLPFEALDFVYHPSRDPAADVRYFVDVLGAELVFAIEAFGARVAMVQPAAGPPALLLADHLEGEAPILVYRVADLERAIADLEARGGAIAERFGIPHGPGCMVEVPGGQRIALYQLTRPEVANRLTGRHDF